MKMSYMAAMIDFFGLLPDQSRMAMGLEIKDAGAREFWIAGLAANGYVIDNA